MAISAAQSNLAVAVFFIVSASLMFTNLLQPSPQRHGRPALEAALAYIDSLPGDAPSFLFPDNQPQVEVLAYEAAGRDALGALRDARRSRYRPAPLGRSALQIVILPGFLGGSDEERKAMLTERGVYPDFKPLLSGLPATHPACSATLAQSHGWASQGVVLVDPQAGAMPQEAVRACVIAGFDYLHGVPVPHGQFDFDTFPDAAVSLVLLDYVTQCAHAGETDRVPAVRSNRGITSLPSLSCIRSGIAGALGENS